MHARTTLLFLLALAPLPALAASCGSSGSTSSGDESNVSHGDWGTGSSDTTTGLGTGTGIGSGGGGVTTTGNPGQCGSGCATDETGAGSGDPFDPATHDSSGVGKDADGALVLDQNAGSQQSLIWIASSQGNVVSKVDTVSFKELGRYKTGSGDPSRTSVDAVGNVYVGNRGGQSVTKILAAGDACPDTNGDGKITTSHGPNEVLAYGQDDCRVWETPLGHQIRGVAAQDSYKQIPPSDPDSPPTIEEKHSVWVGTLDGIVWKLDGATGKVLLTTKSPCPVYGLALDGKGQLWMTRNSCLGRIDTTKCVDDASCEALAICDTSCDKGGACADTCDAAGKQKIALPESTYGITVDFKQRVWLGGGSGLKRYSPYAPAAQRYAAAAPSGFSHGVTADANGFVWGARDPKVVRLNGDTLEQTVLDTPSSKGMAVDKQGKIWAISYQKQYATVITPGPGIGDNAITNNAVTGLVGPYTYSDMTGLQATLAMNAPGHYLETFEGCADATTRWVSLSWEGDVPKGTALMFRVRTADTKDALAKAKWLLAANVPTATSPVDLETKLSNAGVTPGHFLDVDVWLSVTGDDPAVKTPKVKKFGVSHACPPKVE
jgi:hypothetical protein